jgi:hypothetical protein
MRKYKGVCVSVCYSKALVAQHLYDGTHATTSGDCQHHRPQGCGELMVLSDDGFPRGVYPTASKTPILDAGRGTRGRRAVWRGRHRVAFCLPCASRIGSQLKQLAPHWHEEWATRDVVPCRAVTCSAAPVGQPVLTDGGSAPVPESAP